MILRWWDEATVAGQTLLTPDLCAVTRDADAVCVTWLRSALMVMASNLGARSGERSGFAGAGVPDYSNEVERCFRPELRNRVDDLVVFTPLSQEVIHAITRKELAALERREGLLRRGLRLRCTEELIAWLARIGFDPERGARPLQRAIAAQVVAASARFLTRTPGAADLDLVVARDGGGGVSVAARGGD